MNKYLEGLSLILPVYNEVGVVEEAIDQLVACRIDCAFDLQLIIVNDGSTDGTRNILDNLNYDGLKVIHHKRNLGYGAALKTGIKNATQLHIAITDADGTYPYDRLNEFFSIYIEKKLDMIVGARIGKDAKIPWIRRPAKFLINWLANYLTSTRIPDLNSGYRVMRKSAVKKFIRILPDGFSFTSTITMAFLTNNYSVEYIPIKYKKRIGKSKIQPVRDTLNFIQLLIRTTLFFEPLKIFIPFSLILFILSASVLAYSIFFMEVILETTVMILFSSSLQVAAIGMIADLVDRRLTKVDFHNERENEQGEH